MWKHKLCLGTSLQFPLTHEEQIRTFKEIGFDGFFTGWREGAPIADFAKLGRELGIAYQSIHAPFGEVNHVWLEGPKGDEVIEELKACLKDCADNEVGIMVAHAFIGFKDHTPTQIGVDRFGALVKFAEQLGVRIGFENTEGEEYLGALLTAFKNEKAAGFCWDTGHEMCYNHSKDMTALYGDKLICTHLNDNLGIRDFDGEITWVDDLHLLPFDGIADWDGIASRLDRHGYTDFMTFELNTKSKPDRHENDLYDQMDIKLYLTEVYKRACRVAAKRKI